MGKISSQTLAVEVVVHEPTEGVTEVFYFEAGKADVHERARGLTSVGYDNEIGLWEELEHRNRRNNVFPK